MSEFENKEKARAAQDALESVARAGRRGSSRIEAAMRNYLSAERYQELKQDAAPPEPPEHDDSQH